MDFCPVLIVPSLVDDRIGIPNLSVLGPDTELKKKKKAFLTFKLLTYPEIRIKNSVAFPCMQKSSDSVCDWEREREREVGGVRSTAYNNLVNKGTKQQVFDKKKLVYLHVWD